MARKPNPAPRSCGAYPYRVVRPQREDGRWYWRCERRENGVKVTHWTGWATIAEADRAVAAIACGQAAPGQAVDTVRDLLSYWLGAQEQRTDFSASSLRIRTQQCKALAAELSAVKLDRLDRVALEGYRNRRMARAAPRTVGGEMGCLRTAWRWGREMGLTPDRELPQVTIRIVARRTTPIPSRSTIQAAVAGMSGWSRLAVLLLEGTGCRLGEIASLTWDRVDLQNEEIQVRGKTGLRLVPLSPALVRELKNAPRVGSLVLGRGYAAAKNLARFIWAACDAASVPRFSPQGLRKAAVGALYRSGVDIGTAASFMGHSPAVALKHYREASEGDRREALLRSGLGRLQEGAVVQFRRKM